jgi:beta-glucosidase
VTIYLDRPAILTNVKDKVAALFGKFGVSDAALFNVLRYLPVSFLSRLKPRG